MSVTGSAGRGGAASSQPEWLSPSYALRKLPEERRDQILKMADEFSAELLRRERMNSLHFAAMGVLVLGLTTSISLILVMLLRR